MFRAKQPANERPKNLEAPPKAGMEGVAAKGVDPLTDSLIYLAAHHGRAITREAILSSLPILDGRRHVVSRGGVTTAPGVYTLGAPWLTHQSSGLLAGVGKDASRIALDVAAFLGASVPADLPGGPAPPSPATRPTARPAPAAAGLSMGLAFG